MESISLKLRNGKWVGEILDGTAVLPVTAKNYLGVGHGYSVDEHVLAQIMRNQCEHLEFWGARKKRFRMSVQEFVRNARVFDFGYGPKLCCDQKHYEVVCPEPRRTITQEAGNTYASA